MVKRRQVCRDIILRTKRMIDASCVKAHPAAAFDLAELIQALKGPEEAGH